MGGFSRNSYHRMLGCTAAIVCMSVAAPVMAQTRTFDIPAQDASKGIPAFAKQAGIQLLASARDTRGKRTNVVRGSHTVGEALTILLQGTGLEAVGDTGGAGIITIRRRAQQALTADEAALTDVVVVGSRLPISKGAEGPAPVVTFSRGKIDTLGVNSISDLLQYLPQQTFLKDTTGTGGTQTVQLRGLGAGSTLVLINGRRAVPGAIGAAFGNVDLNIFPLAAVERVEILADSASAVYGTDAVGGVLNIVLRDSLRHPEINAYYGTAKGGASETRTSLSVGGDSGTARGLVNVSYYRRGDLRGRDREITNNADYRRFGGTDQRITRTSPGNICSSTGANLPGLSAPCAAVPAGSTGLNLTPADFAATAGTTNLRSPFSENNIIAPTTRYSAFATGSVDLGARTELFGELMYTDIRTNFSNGARSLTNLLVPATNPFNPFGIAVRVNALLPTTEATSPTHETSFRGVGGLKGHFRSWNWELAGIVTTSSGISEGAKGALDAAKVTAALASTTPATALNVFQDGPGGDGALLNSLIAPPTTISFVSRAQQVGGFANGTVGSLPAGPVGLVVGGEWRHESLSFLTGRAATAISGAARESYAAYAEARFPLLSPAQAVPALYRLTFTAAGRLDHYSDFGSTFNSQFGLEWYVVESLLFRGSYGESFRAPGLQDLYQPANPTTTTILGDPRRAGELITGTILVGGNRNLNPERSKAFNVGAVWKPAAPWSPRISINYWHIKQAQRIGSSSAVTVLANEAYFPDRVTRSAPTAADIAAGQPGKITFLNASTINAGRLETNGIDVSASASISTPIGVFAPSVSATRVFRYKSADFPSTPFYDRVGIADFNGTVPDWKVVGSATLSNQYYDLTATARFASGYADTTFNVLNGLRVPSVTLFDLQASVRVSNLVAGLGDAERPLILRVGAVNLFNRKTPFSNVLQQGYDRSQGDIRGRYLYIELSKSF